VAAKVVNFLLSTGGPAKPLDTTDGTLRFCGTPVERHCISLLLLLIIIIIITIFFFFFAFL